MNLVHIVFYLFSAILLSSGVAVITLKNPVHAVLCLVLAFFASSVLWILLQAEFLALVLIFVYVGAVMTLFLFVVMMLNIDTVALREGFVRYLPVGILLMVLLVGLMAYVLSPKFFSSTIYTTTSQPANYSNVKELGAVLYTQYMYAFELAAVILLVAIIAAISLAFRRHRGKLQVVAKQVAVNPKDRVRLVKMRTEKV